MAEHAVSASAITMMIQLLPRLANIVTSSRAMQPNALVLARTYHFTTQGYNAADNCWCYVRTSTDATSTSVRGRGTFVAASWDKVNAVLRDPTWPQ